jgi:hypothetical protein
MKIIESSTKTTNGSSNIVKADGGEFARVQLNVVGVAGTSPTMDVTVEDSVDNGLTFNPIGNFTRKTTTAREVISIAAPFAETLRISWAIAGTNPSFTFSVDLSLATRRGN